MNSPKRPFISAFILVNILLVVGLTIFIFGGFASEMGLDFLPGSAPRLVVTVSQPQQITTGQVFRMAVNLRNAGNTFLNIQEIGFPQGLADKVKVVEIFPTPISDQDAATQTSYRYNLGLAAGEVVDVVFSLKAFQDGTAAGRIQVTGDSLQASSFVQVQIMEPAPAIQKQPLPTPTWIPEAHVPFPSLVQVTAMQKNADGVLNPAWSGSGAIVSPQGLILTSAKAVLPSKFFPVDAIRISMTMQPNIPAIPKYYATILQADLALDIAVVLITSDLNLNPIDPAALNLPAVEIVDGANLQVGDSINILGYSSIEIDQAAMNEAKIIHLEPLNGPVEPGMAEISAILPGGYSGGMVMNREGYLVGLATSSGFTGQGQYAGCRTVVDSNRDGVVDDLDVCMPDSGRVNTFWPVEQAIPFIKAASEGSVNVVEPILPKVPFPSGTEVLLKDDFTKPDTGWTVFNDHNGSGDYLEKEFRFLVNQEFTEFWSLARQSFTDVVIQVKSKVIAPVGNGDWGVLCRFKDPDNYYLFSISEDRFYGIFKKEKGRLIPLVDWQYSRLIQTYTPETLTAACIGDTLTFGLDHTVLAQVRDATFSSGDIGLEAGDWSIPGFGVGFSELVVKKP